MNCKDCENKTPPTPKPYRSRCRCQRTPCKCGEPEVTQCPVSIKGQYLGDLDIFDRVELPANTRVLLEFETFDTATETLKHDIVRYPVELLPQLSPDSQVAASVEHNNSNITVPLNEVRAGRFLRNTLTGVLYVEYADETNAADFVILRANSTNAKEVIVQPTGFYTVQTTHEYIIGVQYFVGENGEPSTVGSQKMFKPISKTKLLINLS